jgi:hypothetical protein
MLKVMTTLFPSLVTSVWVLKTQEGWGGQRGIQASLVLRDFFLRGFPLTRLENLHHFLEFMG